MIFFPYWNSFEKIFVCLTLPSTTFLSLCDEHKIINKDISHPIPRRIWKKKSRLCFTKFKDAYRSCEDHVTPQERQRNSFYVDDVEQENDWHLSV